MLDKSHARLMTFLNTSEINSMLDYDMLDMGTLDISASPYLLVSNTLAYLASALLIMVLKIDNSLHYYDTFCL